MLKKILFACSLTAFAIGFSGFGQASQWGASLPLGAVFFILGFIVTVLEKEAALYDREETQRLANLMPTSVSPAVKTQSLTVGGPRAAF